MAIAASISVSTLSINVSTMVNMTATIVGINCGMVSAMPSANVKMVSAPICTIDGSCSIIASTIAGTMVPAISPTFSPTWVNSSINASIPLSICVLASSSPATRLVNPAIMSFNAGKKPPTTPRFTPSTAVCRSSKLSLNCADAFTASSLITPPSSCTRWRMASVSSALVFSRAPSSVAPRPSNCPARYVRSVSLSTFCRAVMVAPNSSSCDMLAISACDKPSFVNASLLVSAAVASVFIDACMLSIDAPLCCKIASHS